MILVVSNIFDAVASVSTHAKGFSCSLDHVSSSTRSTHLDFAAFFKAASCISTLSFAFFGMLSVSCDNWVYSRSCRRMISGCCERLSHYENRFVNVAGMLFSYLFTHTYDLKSRPNTIVSHNCSRKHRLANTALRQDLLSSAKVTHAH